MQAEPHVHETTRQKERLLDEAQGCQRAKGGLRTTSPLENDQSEGQEAKGADSLWPTVKCHQEVRASLKPPPPLLHLPMALLLRGLSPERERELPRCVDFLNALPSQKQNSEIQVFLESSDLDYKRD